MTKNRQINVRVTEPVWDQLVHLREHVFHAHSWTELINSLVIFASWAADHLEKGHTIEAVDRQDEQVRYIYDGVFWVHPHSE